MIPLPSRRTPRHPGRILVEDYLSRVPAVTQAEVADGLGMSRPRLNELLNGVRGVTPDTALRLARGFGTTAEFWLAAQASWDLYEAARSRKRMREIERITPWLEAERGAEAAPAEAPVVDVPTEIGVVAAGVRAALEGPATAYYEEFLERKGLLAEGRRFARIRAQLDALGPAGETEGRVRGLATVKVPRLAFTAPALTFTD